MLCVLAFRNRDSTQKRSTMPMLLAGREPNDVTRPDLLNRTDNSLHPPKPCRNDQSLPKRMCVPRRARSGLERDARALDKRGIWCRNSGSMRMLPVNHCAGPFAEGVHRPFDFHAAAPFLSFFFAANCILNCTPAREKAKCSAIYPD